MSIDDIKQMVASSKQTINWMGETAWTVPDGRCTTSFACAVRLWADLLGVKG